MLMDSLPVKLASMFLKINIVLLVITLGASSFGIFPYKMNMTQVANNIALDVANKNYVTGEDLEKYVSFATKHTGETGYTPTSFFVFKQGVMGSNALTVEQEVDNVKQFQGMRDTVVIAPKLDVDPRDFYMKRGNEAVVSVRVESLEDGKSLYVDPVGDFNPLQNNADIKRGFEGTNLGNGHMVQRGVPFRVTVKTRYKMSGGVLGFFVHSALPTEEVVTGVTTKYYQYEESGN